MDRLYLVAPLLLLLGCDSKPTETTKPASRVNAVVAKKVEAESPADFCDVHHEDAAGAPAFVYPELVRDAPPAGSGWRWINVWATWCEPCVEEMPRLAAWEGELKSAGLDDVVFLSSDENDQVVTVFRNKHPDAPDSVRMTSPDLLQPWLNGLGLTGSPSLPVHVFVDGSSKVRCIRMGGVTDRDRGAVEALLGS